MGLLDRLTTMGVDSVTGLGDHLQDTEKLGQIGLSPENYNVISAMNAADNMDAGLGSLVAPGALYSIGDTIANPNQGFMEGVQDFGRYMKGVNIQSNPELAKQLMGENYVNQMQGKYALAMDQIGKGIFGKGPNPDLYNQGTSTPQNEPMDIEDFLGTSTPQNLGFIEEAPQVKEAIYQDRIMNPNLPSFVSQPQYRIRDQLKRDFLEGGLFRDAKQSLGQTKDAFLEDVSGLRNMMGSGINNAKEGIMNSSPMNFLRSLPTPGNLLMSIASGRNPLNPKSANYNPTLQGQIDYMKDKGMYGITDQSGLNKITGGRLAGKNLVSMFGSNDLGEMYSKDLSKLQGYLATMPQRFSRLMKNNPAAYQKKIDNLNEKIAQNKLEAQAAQEARQAATAARARAANPNVYANADALGFTNPGGGFKSAGTNENFSNKTGRGRTGYSEGGLASMFTRRG